VNIFVSLNAIDQLAKTLPRSGSTAKQGMARLSEDYPKKSALNPAFCFLKSPTKKSEEPTLLMLH